MIKMNSTVFTSSQNIPVVGRRPNRATWCLAGTGFGKTQGKKESPKPNQPGSGIYTAPRTKKRVNIVEEFGAKNKAPAENVDPDKDVSKGNWFELANLSDFAGEKKRKICELKGSKKTVVLHMFNDTLYAMDAFSTAYQYPLIDGKLEDSPTGPTIETPLDGTVYDLKTGKVIKWCPADGSPMRGLLRTLKSGVQPVPLPVYPVVVGAGGKVMVRLSV